MTIEVENQMEKRSFKMVSLQDLNVSDSEEERISEKYDADKGEVDRRSMSQNVQFDSARKKETRKPPYYLIKRLKY